MEGLGVFRLFRDDSEKAGMGRKVLWERFKMSIFRYKIFGSFRGVGLILGFLRG